MPDIDKSFVCNQCARSSQTICIKTNKEGDCSDRQDNGLSAGNFVYCTTVVSDTELEDDAASISSGDITGKPFSPEQHVASTSPDPLTFYVELVQGAMAGCRVSNLDQWLVLGVTSGLDV